MIHKLYNRKKEIKILIWILLIASTLLILNNKLQYEITKSHVDDVHTMNIGVKSLYSGEVSTLRVGESTRWLARLAYPVAIYYMNGNMGGEHYITGWNYAGGFYIKKHFKSPASVRHDPNIQDFVFAMKFILGTLVVFSFFGASYMLARKYDFITGVSYFVLTISTTMIINMLSVFYTESSLVIIFNLLVMIGLAEVVNKWRLYIWLAFLFAFAVSTKLTGLVFIVPILAIIVAKDKYLLKNMKIEGFLILIAVSYLLINIYATSYMSLFDQMLSNVYHLKTGHRWTLPSGLYQFKLMMKTLSPWVYIFIVSSIFILLFKNIKNKLFILSIVFASIIIFLSQVNVSMSLHRNLTIVLVMMIFIISIAMAYLLPFLIDKSTKLKDKKSIIMLSFIGVLVLFHLYSTDRHNKKASPKLLVKSLQKCKSIATIDIEDGFIKNATKLASMPDKFYLQKQQQSFRDKFLPYDCVAIKKVNNNKHYTNYLLPLDYKLDIRYGKYFVFKNQDRYNKYIAKGRLFKEKAKQLKTKTKLFSSKFDIYKIDNKLILYREKCIKQDIKDMFFLHIAPNNVKDIPVNRQKYKFDNLDFKAPAESFYKNSCYIEKKLPSYKYNAITIGQYNKDGKLWSHKIGKTK